MRTAGDPTLRMRTQGNGGLWRAMPGFPTMSGTWMHVQGRSPRRKMQELISTSSVVPSVIRKPQRQPAIHALQLVKVGRSQRKDWPIVRSYNAKRERHGEREVNCNWQPAVIASGNWSGRRESNPRMQLGKLSQAVDIACSRSSSQLINRSCFKPHSKRNAGYRISSVHGHSRGHWKDFGTISDQFQDARN
jgi:hypothetical protein